MFLKRNGFTRQKLKVVATRQDKYLREMFVADVSLYYVGMLVFVAETGTDTRESLRNMGTV